MDSRTFYDDYVDRQVTVGVNERHRAIAGWLKRFGLRPGHKVLEIGCGVGTVTQLISRLVGADGCVFGVDLSPRSIEAAREQLKDMRNVRFDVGDILEMGIEGDFDVVVLPDVIEHIPLEAHPRLFARVEGWLALSGFALVHYPNPLYLAWCHEHRPELLQLVDQPVHADVLAANVHASGLYVQHLETYSIWIEEGDYVVAVLRKPPADPTFHTIRVRWPWWARVRAHLRRWVR